MIRIAITPERLDDELREATAVRALLEAGWDKVHLRHPDASRNDIRRVIEAIPQGFHDRLVIHGHFDLCNDFNLGGLHLNHRCPTPPALYRGPLSRSCHSVEELRQCSGMAYATLSPVFDSISKQGYQSRFTNEDFLSLCEIRTPVIALGGVTAEQIPLLKRYNFKGFAMLGAIPWNESADNVRLFAEKIIQLQ